MVRPGGPQPGQPGEMSSDAERLNSMPKPSAKAMVSIVYGGDSYLNDQRVRDLTHQALNAYPDADVV